LVTVAVRVAVSDEPMEAAEEASSTATTRDPVPPLEPPTSPLGVPGPPALPSLPLHPVRLNGNARKKTDRVWKRAFFITGIRKASPSRPR
jgi:hypothetical protein